MSASVWVRVAKTSSEQFIQFSSWRMHLIYIVACDGDYVCFEPSQQDQIDAL